MIFKGWKIPSLFKLFITECMWSDELTPVMSLSTLVLVHYNPESLTLGILITCTFSSDSVTNKLTVKRRIKLKF